jgi:hypothetical protein
MTNPKRLTKLEEITNGQPQKLAYLEREKITDNPTIKKRIITGRLIKAILTSKRLEIKQLANQDIKETKTKNKSKACLLKSKTLVVKGKKKSGSKNTKT